MTSPIITEAVRTLVERRDLTRIEASAAMDAIMSGVATNAQIAAFLTALRMKGETVEELIGFAQVMRSAVRNAAICALVATPDMIASMAAEASMRVRSRRSTSVRTASVMMGLVIAQMVPPRGLRRG